METYILYNEKTNEIINTNATAQNAKELVKKYDLATKDHINTRAMQKDQTCIPCDNITSEGIHEH